MVRFGGISKKEEGKFWEFVLESLVAVFRHSGIGGKVKIK